jgi:hypothetical protein
MSPARRETMRANRLPPPCAVCGEETDPMHFDGPCEAYVDVQCTDERTARIWICCCECAWIAGTRFLRTGGTLAAIVAEFRKGSVDEAFVDVGAVQ